MMKWFVPGLTLMTLAVLVAWGIGCQESTPSAAAMAVTPCPTPNPLLFNGFETLADNGLLNDPGNGVTYTSSLSLSNYNVTQGSHSLDLDITTIAGFNQGILIMTGFSPAVWSDVQYLVADVTVDPSVVAGSSYHTLLFVADSQTSAVQLPYFQHISPDFPTLFPGSRSVTWHIDFGAGDLNPGDALSKLTFVFNSNASGTTGGVPNGTGHIYIDNMRLFHTCP